MLTWLIEPLGFEFMRNAIAIGVLIGILSALLDLRGLMYNKLQI
jgi:manganese/iron transport system permease protein